MEHQAGLWILDESEPLALAVAAAIRAGELPALARLLAQHPGLAAARLRRAGCGELRSLLHVVADWPGHFPNGGATVRMLVAAGADVGARFAGDHEETPLHWAASSDDVDVLDALIDMRADIEAPGAVIGGGSPLADARGFKQLKAARRLIERGARVRLVDAATLGLMDRVEALCAEVPPPAPHEITRAFFGACHGGQEAAAAFLLARGAELDWIPPWEPLTPLDAARRARAEGLTAWLRARGARSASELL